VRISLVTCMVLAALAVCTPHAQAGIFSGLFSTRPSMEPYTGPDAGRLVMSVGGYRGANFGRYWLYFRTQDRTRSGDIGYACGHTLGCADMLTFAASPATDYADNIEAADVIVLPLAPGDYEFYDFEVFYNSTYAQSTFRSRGEFSIPFTIKPGEAVYLGEFRAMDVPGQNLIGLPVPAGAKFQIFDESARDLPIARAKDPKITDVKVALPDVSKIGTPAFERIP